MRAGRGCISSVSYIKPQLLPSPVNISYSCISSVSYIKPQPWMLSTQKRSSCISSVSYIKPQPDKDFRPAEFSCISSVSYIKPQPFTYNDAHLPVVYRPFPTSNHNCFTILVTTVIVVYRPFPTSNHNIIAITSKWKRLYIVRFLHQTTTKTIVA